jgi:glycosyltransferase involved in cell wall biosynthesis
MRHNAFGVKKRGTPAQVGTSVILHLFHLKKDPTMPFNWERTPIAASPISAVLPARQAEKTLAGVLDALIAQLEALKRDYEIIIVDDGSSDRTSAVAEEFAERNPRVKPLRHAKPLGYGAALRTGIPQAQHALLVTFPADGSYRPGDLPKLLEWIDHSDVVCGVRQPRPRVNAWFQRWAVRLLFGPQLTDPACHFRLYRRSLFERFPVQSDGCFADVEIAAKANFLECLLGEADVAWTPPAERIHGPSAWRDPIRLLRQPQFHALGK